MALLAGVRGRLPTHSADECRHTSAASGGDWLDVAAASARVSASASAYTQPHQQPLDWRGRHRFAGPISWGVHRILYWGSRSSANRQRALADAADATGRSPEDPGAVSARASWSDRFLITLHVTQARLKAHALIAIPHAIRPVPRVDRRVSCPLPQMASVALPLAPSGPTGRVSGCMGSALERLSVLRSRCDRSTSGSQHKPGFDSAAER
jgi:hypothetical protein